ncbi:hypothetical protein ORI99_01790 [Alishewanella sp. SMS9]|uniref:hypothetical protein n=1 Tax=Burkholderia vietnamiensis TaxID=60552 RepID=UPI002794E00D|nr:hypothetical protein [Alishewanella sp. SMS9]
MSETEPKDGVIEQGSIESSEAQDWATAEALASGAIIAPPGATAVQNEALDIRMADVLGPAIQTTADLLAPNWEITQDESAALGEAWGSVIDVWFPDLPVNPKWAALGMAAFSTAMVLKSRAGVPLKAIPEKKTEQGAVNG